MRHPRSPQQALPLARWLQPGVLWPILVALAALLYLFGLGGPYAPTNGDEMVYIHIARMTAESGHWLPLQSELLGTRNTKPPLLIWQAMVAGGWGAHWDLFWLRLPSVLYTFATTGLVAFFAYHLSLQRTPLPGGAYGMGGTGGVMPHTSQRAGAMRNACLAAALYLLYFSTFRYGRAYLTSAPETFWLALPLWWVLWQMLRQGPVPGWLAHTCFGVAMGLGAAYKSFALLAPAAATLWCVLLVMELHSSAHAQPKPARSQRLSRLWPNSWPAPVHLVRPVLRTSLKVGWSTLLGLGIFALWFVLDPDPAAVWQEFVVAENAGKMSGAQGYWHAALFGAYPMWTQLLAYPANAGLLFFATLGFCLWALRAAFRRGIPASRSREHWLLILWLGLWLLIFTIPSQRSERYVIPAMPALAIAMALVWERIPRLGFWVTALMTVPALVMLARIGWVMGEMGAASGADTALTLAVSGIGLVAAVAGLLKKQWTANASLLTCLCVLGSFGCMVQPLSTPQAHYSPAVQAQMRGKTLAVPNGFTGQYERYHFVLPGTRITPFDAEGRNTGALYPDLPAPQRLERLLSEFDAVVWLQDDLSQTQPSCAPTCRVVAQRWHVKSRHKGGEVALANLWYPQQWLFRTEWLVVGQAP